MLEIVTERNYGWLFQEAVQPIERRGDVAQDGEQEVQVQDGVPGHDEREARAINVRAAYLTRHSLHLLRNAPYALREQYELTLQKR